MEEQQASVATPGELPMVIPANLLDRVGEWAERKFQAAQSGELQGPQIRFCPRLNETLGGYIEHGVHWLHGSPNVGKSSYVNQLAVECGVTALVVSTEMNAVELTLRQIARILKKKIRYLRCGKVSGDNMRLFAKAAAKDMPQYVIADVTACLAPLTHIQAAIRTLKDDKGRMLLVIDSLHSWARANVEGANDYDRLMKAGTALDQLAHQEGIPIILVAERSRAGLQNDGLSGVKGGTIAEYIGRSVSALDSVNDGVEDAEGAIAVDLFLSKNKDGESRRRFPFRFFPEYCRFETAE
jgi:replicative DNA helicase